MVEAVMKVVFEYERDFPGLGQRIREARGDRRVEEVAVAAGISGGYWYDLEGDRRLRVSADVIRRIGEVLGKNLLEEKEEEGDD